MEDWLPVPPSVEYLNRASEGIGVSCSWMQISAAQLAPEHAEQYPILLFFYPIRPTSDVYNGDATFPELITNIQPVHPYTHVPFGLLTALCNYLPVASMLQRLISELSPYPPPHRGLYLTRNYHLRDLHNKIVRSLGHDPDDLFLKCHYSLFILPHGTTRPIELCSYKVSPSQDTSTNELLARLYEQDIPFKIFTPRIE
ncbi:Hypothetical protein DHA2_150844 [Giardia duodenalis]|uniref:Uncharacterized protein n=1 Tax=Giardia intestinalis TaxID=5741 RepID=V6TDQ1_GIAIN|nr:Hypothetical protein DHA2_150844 [Giardia intestinalis]